MARDSERTKSLFSAARDLTDAARRRTFLDEACSGDQALRARVERLLNAAEEADDFLAGCAPALEAAAAGLDPAQINPPPDLARSMEEKPGSRIGPYKLLEKIGEGGCGIVYMAEQERPVRRRVALKIIKLGMDTRSVIARFEAERQALALMDHPNITRVLDAGATDAGRPYFVMDLVYGSKITDYCDQNELSVEERLKIFTQVCQGLQHAHQKGIIHRDIKPSNILVTMHDGEPVPKVIDFGIAKATEQPLTDKTLFTSYAQLIGTPAYMSPEQMELSGPNLDTRSDIYCLGVLLYELLTGRTPFDTAELLNSGVDEMRRTVREREPFSPSARLRTLSGEELTKTAIKRQVDPRRFPSHLRGDLDRIVMKCLEKNRNRRYETANGLAMDIRRHLNDEPVLARPPSNWYRLQKLVRRNWIVFASGAAVATALLIGTVASTWLFLRERDARRRALTEQHEAESALREVELQRETELRGRVTQAALLLAQGKYQEADKLVGGFPLDKPLADPAVPFRTLGYWHALQGRWPLAVERLGTLVKVDQSNTMDVVTLDYIALGTALIADGDLSGYERFRQAAVLRFTGTTNFFEDRIIRFCLLLPANQQMMQNMLPRADFMESRILEEVNSSHPDIYTVGWQSLALPLFEYRQGDYAKAAEWSRRCLAYPSYVPARSAAANAILAMSCWQMNEKEPALAALRQGQDMIEGKYKPGTNVAIAPKGIWFDLEFGRILLGEASKLLGDVPGQARPAAP
jgi:eukaryotic-like serine/threonine-protein kinase